MRPIKNITELKTLTSLLLLFLKLILISKFMQNWITLHHHALIAKEK